MTNLERNLRARFCPETAGDIILALKEADTYVRGDAVSIDLALNWKASRQGHEFWSKIDAYDRPAIKKRTLDIYTL
jgi:hypothetical protein